jgi:hypothetical protein
MPLHENDYKESESCLSVGLGNQGTSKSLAHVQPFAGMAAVL